LGCRNRRAVHWSSAKATKSPRPLGRLIILGAWQVKGVIILAFWIFGFVSLLPQDGGAGFRRVL
jgi:hypothetical protein